ncbi:uncharacterized protein LOC116112284 [Pistacia vera]|uniref:uncharacterized protein LOC116112284 n=1 Tax=Pistacia vera TaxID=55513 RepID=UPI001263B31F|nr:uncharacterized protein LOC116112284 [Pistacia vera]
MREKEMQQQLKNVFDNLKKLLLEDLKSSYVLLWKLLFTFSIVGRANYRRMPNMKTFSQGILRTPKLQKVDYEEIKYRSRVRRMELEKIMEVENEGNDLNKTYKEHTKNRLWDGIISFIKQDKNATLYIIFSLGLGLSEMIKRHFPELKFLTFQDSSTEISYNQHPNSFYQNLTHLILSDCGNLKYAFPSFIAKSLHQLQHLKIHNCKVLEEIVAKEGANEDDNFVFPHINSDLEELKLKNKLRWTEWQGRSKTLEIRYDYELANIPVGLLRRFENVEVLLLNSCEYKEIFSCRKDEKQMQITSGPSPTSFQYLKVLSLYSCTGLMKLITPSMAGSLVHLIEMSIEYCGMLIEIVENEGDATTTTTEIVFDNLKKLSLEGLVSLTCFCSGNYYFNFPSLKEFMIHNCPNMKTFSKGILSTPKLQKVNCQISNNDFHQGELMEVENELNKTIQGAYKKQVDSNLKELTLSGRDIISIWEGEFP